MIIQYVRSRVGLNLALLLLRISLFNHKTLKVKHQDQVISEILAAI